MAHKKGQGATRNGRDSNPQHRGVKAYGGQPVRPGQIIIRQCGTVFRAGFNVKQGRDFTLYSVIDGVVKFESRNRVSVTPLSDASGGAAREAGAPKARTAAPRGDGGQPSARAQG